MDSPRARKGWGRDVVVGLGHDFSFKHPPTTHIRHHCGPTFIDILAVGLVRLPLAIFDAPSTHLQKRFADLCTLVTNVDCSARNSRNESAYYH